MDMEEVDHQADSQEEDLQDTAEAVVASQGEDLQDFLDEDLTSACRLACETLA